MFRSSIRRLAGLAERSAVSRSPLTSRVLGSQSRNYAQQPNEPGSSEHKSTPPPPPPKGYKVLPLVLVGAAALGLSWYNLGHTNSVPKGAVEPVRPKKNLDSTEKPLFKDGEISVIYVLGGPGAGKGTQCAKLVSKHHFVHLSAGDLLRAEQKEPGSKYGELIARYIKEGQIVPQEITIALLRKAIVTNYNENGSTKFLVDGFPRKMDQALTFEDQVAHSKFTLFFECPENVMLGRLLERGKTSGRSDDNVESIKKRFRTFVETSMPVVDYFDKQGKVLRVNCNEPVDVVFGHVEQELQSKGI